MSRPVVPIHILGHNPAFVVNDKASQPRAAARASAQALRWTRGHWLEHPCSREPVVDKLDAGERQEGVAGGVEPDGRHANVAPDAGKPAGHGAREKRATGPA